MIQALLVPTPNAVDLETIKRYFDQGAMVSAIVGSGEYAGCNALTLAIKRQLPLDIVLLIVDKARTEQIATAKGEIVPFFDHPDQNGPMPFDEATARDHKTVVQTLVLDCGVPLSAKAFGIVLDALAMSTDVEDRRNGTGRLLGQVEIGGDVKARARLELEVLDGELRMLHAAGEWLKHRTGVAAQLKYECLSRRKLGGI